MSLITAPARTAPAGLFKIAEQTLGEAAASIDFQSIPQGYKNLLVEASLRSTVAATVDTVYVALNADTTDANYRAQGVQSSNTTTSAAQNIGAANVRGQVFATAASSTATDFADIRILIPGYSGTTKTKILQMENEAMLTRASGGMLLRRAYLAWLSTAAVNQLTFSCGATFLAGSAVSIYGVKSAFG